MSKNSVFDREWIDLVFEGRNKEYGAYKLRKDDSKTTMIALFTGIALLGAAVGIPYVVGQLSPKTAGVAKTDDGGMVLTPVDLGPEVYTMPEEQPKQPEQPQPEEAAAPAAPAENTVALREPEATSNEVIEPIITMTDVQNANPGPVTTPGVVGGDPLSNTPGVTGGTATTPVVTDEAGTGGTVVYAPDEKPDFPGGITKFRQWVGDHFNTSDIQTQATIKVTVSFVVEKDGTLSNIKILKDPGYGAGKEAVRVLKSLKTKWKPGKVKGQPVRTAYTLPIAIQVN